MGFHGKTSGFLGGKIASILETSLNELSLTLKVLGNGSCDGFVFGPCTSPPFSEMVRVMVSPERQKLAGPVLAAEYAGQVQHPFSIISCQPSGSLFRRSPKPISSPQSMNSDQ